VRWVRKVAIASSALALSLSCFVYWESRNLPGTEEIRRELSARTTGRTPANWVPLSAISKKLQAAVIASEDLSFYRHHGLDYDETWEAFVYDLRVGRWRRGGSTITQQVAKNLFLSPERTLLRKIREAILAWRLERTLSKDEILEAYLNIADWGDGIVGGEAAAQFFFSKPAKDLTWAEAALLAAILSNPHRLSPIKAPEEARRRRQIVLSRLLLNEDIGPDEFREATLAPLFHQAKIESR
jgi:monofunctional biosynthetic peptidoglycan transglycosylase